MTGPDHLRDALAELADAARPADLYDGAVRRSRTIARREAAVGTGAAVVALALLTSGLWQTPDRPVPVPALAASPPAASPAPSTSPRAPALPIPSAQTLSLPPTTPVAATQRRKNRPMIAASTPAPRSQTLADLPGRVFYERPGDRPDVVRMSPADGVTATVLAGSPSPVGISPDGGRIAYEKDGELLVGDTGGGEPARLATGVTTDAQAPAWSPDGDRLLVQTGAPAILRIASGELTPLPADLGHGLHFRWSGDGSKVVYATASCALRVAATAGWIAVAVPMLGDSRPADNPEGLAACRPTSVDATGSRVTVPLEINRGGAAGARSADAVVDTTTGDVMPVPVAGSVVGTAFGPDGNLLVRTVHDGVTTLSLFAPDGDLLVQASEPPELEDLALLAYTR
jgi:TolB protein